MRKYPQPMGCKKRRGQQRMRRCDGVTELMHMSLRKLWELVMDRDGTDVLQSMGSQRVGHDLATEQQSGCMWDSWKDC